jgi:uncharacterized OB-fold protein
MREAGRPRPMPTRETAPFWEGAGRGELTLPRCRACGRLHYPPPPRCVECLTETLEWTRLSGRGRLVGWTTIHSGLARGFDAPFTIGEIELAEQKGLVIAALLVDLRSEPLRLGQSFVARFAPGAGSGYAYPQFEPSG